MPSKKQRAKQNKLKYGKMGQFKTLYITPGNAFPQFREYVIKQDAKEFEDLLQKVMKHPKQQNKIVIEKIKQNIIKYTPRDMDSLREHNSPLYTRWNEDVVLYAIYDYVINQTLIPLVNDYINK